MKRIIALFATLAVSLVVLGAASPASATIHPIMLGWVCGNAPGDPGGQTPGENHSDQSTLRALQSTGVLTITSSGPVLDLTRPASKFNTFDPATDTGTSDHPGYVHCTAN